MPTATRDQTLSPRVKIFITQTVSEIVHDPDFGMELTETVKRRLRAASRKPQRTIPLSKIKKEYS